MCGRYAIYGPRSLTAEEKRFAATGMRRGSREPRIVYGPIQLRGAGISLESPAYDARPSEQLPMLRLVEFEEEELRMATRA